MGFVTSELASAGPLKGLLQDPQDFFLLGVPGKSLSFYQVVIRAELFSLIDESKAGNTLLSPGILSPVWSMWEWVLCGDSFPGSGQDSHTSMQIIAKVGSLL